MILHSGHASESTIPHSQSLTTEEIEDTDPRHNKPPKKPHHIISSSEEEAQSLSLPVQPQKKVLTARKRILESSEDDNDQAAPCHSVQPQNKV